MFPGENRTPPQVLLAAVVVLALFITACQANSRKPFAHRTLTVLLLPRQVPVFSGALVRAFAAEMPDVEVRFVQREGNSDYISALQKGEVDLAFVLADTAYLAFVGQLDGVHYDQLRGIAALDPYPLFLVVRGGSAIRAIEDLQGKHVNAGSLGALGTDVAGDFALKALGIKAEISHGVYTVASARLLDGNLDAMFAQGSYPPDRLRDLLNHGARILPLSRVDVARLHRYYPFVRGMVIPAGVIGDEPILTIALDRLLVCRAGLDEDLVYGVTKALFASLPDLATLDVALRQMNAEDAPATPIPLHEGAARYYREQAASD
jgi:TRAP transporter TAXI family solute receptor